MKAITVTSPGGPEALVWGTAPEPRPGPGDVIVQVAATAVNRADLHQRRGRYPVPPDTTEILGLECSGTVVEVGPEVREVARGDRVCALLDGGGYAERVAVPAGQLLRIPDGLDFAQAAALPEALCTVWLNLMTLGALAAGQTVLIHGGASGIGVFAIQLVRALGARAIVTVGSPRKAARCRDLGAIAVDYNQEDFVSAVHEHTGGRGADLVLDCVGGPYFTRNLAALADGGRLIVIGLLGGVHTDLDLNTLMRRRLTVTAGTLRSRTREEKAEIVAEVGEHLWPLVEAGTLRPVVDRYLPLARAAEAHRVVEASEHIGKVVLLVDDPDPHAGPAGTPDRLSEPEEMRAHPQAPALPRTR
ncbi:NAD(P)H-quinone oxidoreductase [Streptomyces adelaidensis]|uniref:NAD(P)H-quinone oxidoreductase n=1 Tax=Streptomyces adelaidensis TaxID=2796465 RepID=UPI00190366B3|nr:NAD(P)H-quinone oxidoreductase [Streptomyces adelaidensis]